MHTRIRTLASTLAVLAVGLSATAPAGATEVSSPPIWVVDAQGQGVLCMVTNLGKKSIEVEIGTQQGEAPFELGIATAIASGASYTLVTSANGAVRCVVTGKFRKRKIAITACAGDQTTSLSETCTSGP